MMTPLRKPYLSARLLSPELIFSQAIFADSTVRIEDVWIAKAPPVNTVLAGYLRVENDSNQAVSFV